MNYLIRRLEDMDAISYDLLLEADPSKEIVDSYISRGDCFILLDRGKIVGVYVLLATRPNTVELVNIAILDSYQGKGLGKKLVKDAIARAKELGFNTIELGTGNSSISQIALYQKCGFRITGVERDFFIKNYYEPIYENGIQCMDMIRFSMELR